MRLINIYDENIQHLAILELYHLLKERSVENDPYVNISHRKLPSFHEHRLHVLNRPHPYWYLIYADESIGSINLTMRNEIGIVLFQKHRGKGYGKQALQLFIETHEPLPAVPSLRAGHFLANINPLNQASISLFEGMGFKHIQNTYKYEG